MSTVKTEQTKSHTTKSLRDEVFDADIICLQRMVLLLARRMGRLELCVERFAAAMEQENAYLAAMKETHLVEKQHLVELCRHHQAILSELTPPEVMKHETAKLAAAESSLKKLKATKKSRLAKEWHEEALNAIATCNLEAKTDLVNFRDDLLALDDGSAFFGHYCKS